MKLKSLTVCAALILSTLAGIVGASPATVAAAASKPRAPGSAGVPILYSGTVLFIDSHRIGATGNLHRNYVAGTKVQLPGLPVGQVAINPVFRYRGADPTPDPADPAGAAADGDAAAGDAADGDTDIDSEYLLAANTVMLETVAGKPLYRMWLRSGANIGYRESSDGVHWHIHDPDSVVIVKGVTGASVMKDTASGLYYLMGWSRAQAGYVEMVSKDGINFKATTDFVGILSQLTGDVIQANTDPVTGAMVAIAKQRSVTGQTCRATPQARSGGRTFGTFVSSSPSAVDIRTFARSWAAPRVVATADCVDVLSVPPVNGTVRPAHLYGIPFQRYGDQVIGFPWFFQVTKVPPSADKSGYTDGPVDTQIASTPDVRNVPWTRSDPVVRVGLRMKRPSLIPRGPAGSWDGGMLYGQSGLVDLGTRMGLYYTGWNSTHLPTLGRQAHVGMATWRKDGFVGLKVSNPRQRGWLRTQTFQLPSSAGGRTLYVNAVLGQGRNLRVAAVDAITGRVIPGFRASDSTVVRGDNLSARVTWRMGRKLGVLRSRAIRLLFSYSAGSLYSFRVA